MRLEEYKERISKLKKDGLLTDAVKLFLAGMMAEDQDLTGDQSRDLLDEIEFDFDTYGAVGELVLFGDIVDFKGQKIDFKKEQLINKS